MVVCGTASTCSIFVCVECRAGMQKRRVKRLRKAWRWVYFYCQIELHLSQRWRLKLVDVKLHFVILPPIQRSLKNHGKIVGRCTSWQRFRWELVVFLHNGRLDRAFSSPCSHKVCCDSQNQEWSAQLLRVCLSGKRWWCFQGGRDFQWEEIYGKKDEVSELCFVLVVIINKSAFSSNRIGIKSSVAAKQVVDGSTVQMFVRFLSEKVRRIHNAVDFSLSHGYF